MKTARGTESNEMIKYKEDPKFKGGLVSTLGIVPFMSGNWLI